MHKSRYVSVESFVTKDGSIIRELMHPSVHGNANQSLAEAIVPVGQGTHPRRRHHLHPARDAAPGGQHRSDGIENPVLLLAAVFPRRYRDSQVDRSAGRTAAIS